MAVIPQELLSEIDALKSVWKYDDALRKVNNLLVRDPSNQEALFQVADIEYRRGEIGKAEKPIDFLLHNRDKDPMAWYIKWVLEMEKTNRKEAKKYLQKALKLLEIENPEIMRCYGLCEYRSGNREKWINCLQKALEINETDAEVILNLIELSLLEKKINLAKKYIKYYHKNRDRLHVFDRSVSYYDEKVAIFEEFLQGSKKFK